MKNILKRVVVNNEYFIFLLVVILNAIPIFIGKYFPTMDGAAHLHNSNIIKELVFSFSSFFEQFYLINSEIIPNWMGHALLAMFNLVASPHLSEKILLLVIVVGIPVAGRRLIFLMNPSNVLVSYLFLPMVYSTSFILGFYNFSLGLLLFIIILAYWFQLKTRVSTKGQALLLSILFLLLYFSHALLFLITLSGIGLSVVFQIFRKREERGVVDIRSIVYLLVTTIVPLLFFVEYSLNRDVLGESQYLNWEELFINLTSLNSLLGYNSEIEGPYLKVLSSVVFFLYSVQFYSRIKMEFKESKDSDYWLIFALCILVGYFVLPDSGGGAGFISMRLAQLFFIVGLVWVASHKVIMVKVLIPLVLISFYANYKLLDYYKEVSKELNLVVSSIEDIADKIPEESIVVPFDFSGHWLMGHFSNYLAVEKNILILENYEAGLYYFPTQLKKVNIPNLSVGKSMPECPHWLSNSENTPTLAKYIFILGEISNASSSCNTELSSVLSASYTIKHKNEHCSLYVLNQ